MDPQIIFANLATFASGIFAGAALYINMAEHPARMTCDVRFALRQWAHSYARATRMQAPLALVACVAALAHWSLHGDTTWLIGALAIGLVIPFTLIGIMPTNNRLLAMVAGGSDVDSLTLLQRWNRMHALRTALSLFAFGLFLYAH